MNNPATLPEVARKRGLQAFWQGLSVDVVVAASLLISATFMDIDSTEAFWAFVILLGKTIVVSATQYTVRRYVDQSGYHPDGSPIFPGDSVDR